MRQAGEESSTNKLLGLLAAPCGPGRDLRRSGMTSGWKHASVPFYFHFNGRAACEQEIARPRGSVGHRRVTGLCGGLVGLHRVAVAVLLPARLVFFLADGLFLTIADGGDAVGGNAELHEVIL